MTYTIIPNETFYFNFKIDCLRELSVIHEFNNDEMVQAWNCYLEDNLNDLTSEEEKQDFRDNNHIQHLRYKVIQPQLNRKTIFLQTYFSFEAYLNEMCDYYKQKLGKDTSFKEIKGKGIKRAKQYLKSECNISKPFTSVEWNNIKVYNTLRNALVHNEGNVNKSKLPIKFNGLTLIPTDSTLYSIKFDDDFLPEVFNTLDKFSWLFEQ